MKTFRGVDAGTSLKLKKLLTYTEDEQKIIDKVTHGVLFGLSLKVEPYYFSTIEGVQYMLDHFKENIGIVYYFKVVNSQVEMGKMIIEKVER